MRLVLNRPLAIGLGTALAAPAAALVARDYEWESGMTDGLALVALATGVALVWSGISGRKPDWYDSDV